MDLSPTLRRVLYCSLIVIAFLLLGGGIRRNVSDPIHWDVPVYLRDARQELSHGSMLRRIDAGQILEKLEERRQTGRFRCVSRYGNVWILARVLGTERAGLAGFARARAVYSLMLVAFLVCLYFLLSRALAVGGAPPLDGAAAVAVLLIVAMPLLRYLNGNPVSEVPALLLTTLTCLGFVQGLRRERLWYSGLAGVALLLAYVVRMDACITPMLLPVAGLAFYPRHCGLRNYLAHCLVLVGAFGLGLLVYVFYAGGIVSPHNFLRFVLEASPQHFTLAGDAGIEVVLRSLVPFLPLAAVSLFSGRRWSLLMAWLWLLAGLLPFGVLILRGAWIESRFLAMVWPPLALVCVIGIDGLRRGLRRLPGRLGGSFVTPAAATMLLAAAFLLCSDAGNTWTESRGGRQLAIPDNEKRVYGVADIQKVADGLLLAGGRFEDLVLPGVPGVLRCLFEYCADDGSTDGPADPDRVFGAVRTVRRETDLDIVRRAAADRLGVANQARVAISEIVSGGEWNLVIMTRPPAAE